MDRSATGDFLIVIHSNHGPLTVSERKTAISVENCKLFPLSDYLTSADGIQLGQLLVQLRCLCSVYITY